VKHVDEDESHDPSIMRVRFETGSFLKDIDSKAFMQYENLISIVIPSSVKILNEINSHYYLIEVEDER
jgi:hypothetical protein